MVTGDAMTSVRRYGRRQAIGVGAGGALAAFLVACGASSEPAAPTAPLTATTASGATKASGADPTKAAVASAPAPKGFANPNLIVSVDWLKQHASDAGLRIIDARSAADYVKGHLPGAVSLPVAETFDPAYSKNLPDTKEKLEALFGQKGIANSSRVVIYDNGKETPAARLFWTLEYAGHTNVAVLDGGLKAWAGSISTDAVSVSAATFVSKIDPSKLPTKGQCALAIGDPTKVVLDARSPAEFRGEDVRTKFGGHIPGAVNIEWTENFGSATQLREPESLTAMYEAKGVKKDKEVYALCQTGQRSSVSYLVLRLLGYPKVGNYAGSWVEWGNDESTPKTQGA